MIDQTHENKTKQQLISDARAILEGGNISAQDTLVLAIKLHKFDEFSIAKNILDLALNKGIDDDELKQKFAQKRALSTYKDTHLNRQKALDLALEILGETFDLASTRDQETLGLAGAIYKRKWETDGIKVNLEQSLIYYQRGYELGVKHDAGYTAINAAYILDLLAHLELKQAGKLDGDVRVSTKRRKDAEKIREKIIDFLSENLKNLEDSTPDNDDYWSIATLAEAYFGTGQYALADKCLTQLLKISDLPKWQYVTLARQLVHLAKLQAEVDLSDDQLEKSDAWQTLTKFLGKEAYALRSMYRGKVGLALSGGGFRASLYHIGVLAKLAELDLLRHIEVLSCVSGGSILGAHYYLELRRLIHVEKKPDTEITRDDYIQLVKNLQDDFLAGVQQNPRVSLLANPWNNLKMIFVPQYSRTQRLGELYEELIYSRVKDGQGEDERWLNGLYINPVSTEDFLPRRDNWSLQCKVPELILNSTTLNTGHNWQFTASWMGESPSQIDPDIDTNDRYRRSYYREAPEPHQKIRLGSAVGASSCVPGLFEPLILQGLYQDTTVRLIDGGVYDNQGVASLIEQDCNVIISSDAAGHMNTEKDPGGGVLKPLKRTNRTLMHRVRESQYQDLKTRARAGIIKGFAYVHLKQGLAGKDVKWAENKKPNLPDVDANAKTEYGIRKDIQELLSALRTDLDTFSDIEAYALMTSGYCAIDSPVKKYLTEFPLHQGEKPDWKFLKVEAAMKQDSNEGEALTRLKTNLEAGAMTFGKVWKLDKRLNTLIKSAGVILLLSLVYFAYTQPEIQPFGAILGWLGAKLTLGAIMWTFAILLLVGLVSAYLGTQQGQVVKQALNFRDLPRRFIVGVSVGIIGGIGANIHLRFFEKMFKSIGRVD